MFTTPDCARHKGWSLAYLLVACRGDEVRFQPIESRDTLWIQIFRSENVSRNGGPWRCFGHIPMATKLSTHPCLDPQKNHPSGGACRDVCSSCRQGNNKRQVVMDFEGCGPCTPKNWFPFHPGIHFHPKLNTLIEGGNFLCHIVQGPSFLVRRLKMCATDLIWKWLYLKHFVNNQVLLCHGVAQRLSLSALVQLDSGSIPCKGLQLKTLLHETWTNSQMGWSHL